jgi:hypothetical protein
MATQEFYIRGENDTEARGPFTQEQLASLVEAQQVTPETLYYDASLEQWVAISSNASLLNFLFPEKRKLKVRAKENVQTLNVENASDVPISVHDMLAAAEGRTSDTFGKGDPKLATARVAEIGRLSLILMLALSVFGLLTPRLEPLYSLDWVEIAGDPFILFGLLDVFFLIVLLLGATAFYPYVRFRALLALGFFGLLLYFTNDYLTLAAITAGALGAYVTTISVSWIPMLPAAALGLAGMAALAYLRVFA